MKPTAHPLLPLSIDIEVLDENKEVIAEEFNKKNPQENYKGGAGSGNFGHAGRPGLVGGSSSDGATNVTKRNIDSPSFSKWFKNSVIVNPDGSPKVVYHGTMRDFTEFVVPKDKIGVLDRSIGIHIAEDPNIASRFALGGGKAERQEQIAGGNVKPVYLSLQNPLVVPQEKNEFDQTSIANHIVETVMDNEKELFVEWCERSRVVDKEIAMRIYDTLKEGKPIREEDGFPATSTFNGGWKTKKISPSEFVKEFDSQLFMLREKREEVVNKYIEIMQSRGYDGLVYQNTAPMETQSIDISIPNAPEESLWKKREEIHFDAPESTTCYIVFNPSDIKSVFNEGTFDPDNPNILKEVRMKNLRVRGGKMKWGCKTMKGGPGSGNFNHAGRPGEVGGSTPDNNGIKTGISRQYAGAQEKKTKTTELLSMNIKDRKAAFEAMGESGQDDYTDAENSIRIYQDDKLSFAGSRPEHSGDVKSAISQRLKQIGNYIPVDSSKTINATVSELDSYLEKCGTSSETRHRLAMEAVDALSAQENESLSRSLGDHGINHIRGNIDFSLGLANEIPGADSDSDKAQILLTNIFHDTGYMTEPSRMFLDSAHARWSQQHYDENISPLVEDALGKREARKVSTMIRTHASTDIDYENDPVGTAVRMADNMSLFHREKLPGLLRYIPQNIGVLETFARGKISLEDARQLMEENVKASKLSREVKKALLKSVNEVSPLTPKFTLGMTGGEVKKFKWTGDHIKVTLKKSDNYTRLQKLLDLGQRQFGKYAETYGQSISSLRRGLLFKFRKPPEGGNVLLESDVA